MSRFFPDMEVWNPKLKIAETKKMPESKNGLDEIFDEFYTKLNASLNNTLNEAEAVGS